MKAKLKDLVNTLGPMFSRALTNNKDGKYTDVLQYIANNVPKVAKALPLFQQVYWILNNISEMPHCQNPNCQKQLTPDKFINMNTGYRQYCSKRCRAEVAFNSSAFMLKCKQTKLERYGSETWNNREKCKQTKLERYGSETWNNHEKTKQTNLERYGATCPVHNQNISEQIRKSNKQKFGDECIFKTEHFKQKRVETCMKNFGVEYPMQSKEVQAKSKQTCKLVYGVEYVQQNNAIKQKSIDTNIKKYGVVNPAQSQQIKDKTRQTCQLKYGVDAPAQNHDIRIKQQQKYTYNNINFDSQLEIAYYIWLTDNSIQFEYQPNSSISYMYNEKLHYYIPDFKVGNTYIEIKGDQFFKTDGTMQNPYNHSQDGLYEAKHKCMLANNVVILRDADIKPILQYISKTYGKTYLKQFKNDTNKSNKS